MKRVVPTTSMSSADFIRHLNKRHVPSGDYSNLTQMREGSADAPADRALYETYHRYCHEKGSYKHEHE